MRRKISVLLALLWVVLSCKEFSDPTVSLEWVGHMDGYNTVSAPAVAADGSVYAATDRDSLYKFDEDGSLLWKEEIISDPENRSMVYATPSIDDDGTVYIAAGSSRGMARCVAFNPDGSRKWTFSDFWNQGSAHKASVQGGMVAIGKSNIYLGNNGATGTVLAVGKADGTRKGYVVSGGSGPTGGGRSGIVLSNAGLVHWSGGQYGIWGASRAKLDQEENGSLYYWNEFTTPRSRSVTNSISALGCMNIDGTDCIIGVMTDRTSVKVYAVDAAKGTQVSLVRISDTALQDQGSVVTTREDYIVAPLNSEEGKSNGGIVIVDPRTSGIKARYNISGNVPGTPAVDKAGNIHFFTEDGLYYIVRPDYADSTCVLKAKVDMVSLIRSDSRYSDIYSAMDSAKVWCSAVIGDDGKIYTCFTDKSSLAYGGVICLSSSTCKGPAKSDWPMIGGGSRHTGRQKGLMIDENKSEPIREIDLTPYPSLMSEAMKRGQSLTSFFDELIAVQKGTNPRNKVYIVAHRANTCAGIAAGVPDNSLAAIRKAVEMGADMVELDVRTTKDGHLVLMHDATIDASTDGTGEVADYTLEQLRSFNMDRAGVVYLEEGKPVRVPTLEEALRECKDKIYINLDLKHIAVPADLVKVIRKTGMQDQVMLFCGGKAAEEYQRLDSSIALHPYVGTSSDVDQYLHYDAAKLFQYGFYDWLEGTHLAKEVRTKGRLTYSNILNYDAQTMAGNYLYIDRFIASETDYIQTDYCELIATYLRDKGLR